MAAPYVALMPAVVIETVRLSWIQTFIALADCGDQISAARFLKCSQTMVSLEVAKLERWLGIVLLAPTRRRGLTAEAEVVLPVLREVAATLLAARISSAPASDLSLTQLHNFIGWAELGSQQAVAAKHGWSRMTVSRNCRMIEKWLGKILFDCRKPPLLSEVGVRFICDAKHAWALLSSLRAEGLRQPASRITYGSQRTS